MVDGFVLYSYKADCIGTILRQLWGEDIVVHNYYTSHQLRAMFLGRALCDEP
jgi:hypothetical protein